MLLGFPGSLVAQDIFKAKWVGIGAQTFTPTGSACITQILTSGPDSLGYVYLIGVASNSETQPFFRTRWNGTFVQTFSPTSGCLRGFIAESDSSGYIYLKAYTDSDTGYIIKSAYVGTFAQSFNASPCYIKGFSARSDSGGFVVLSADTICSITSINEGARINSLEVISISVKGEKATIRYAVPRYGKISLTVYNASGRRVFQREYIRHVGIYEEGFRASPGVYIVFLRQEGDKVITKFVKSKK